MHCIVCILVFGNSKVFFSGENSKNFLGKSEMGENSEKTLTCQLLFKF